MRKFLRLSIASILLMTACDFGYFQDADLAEFVWDPSLAVPLGEVTYTVSELFNEISDGEAQIGPNEENVVSVVYEQQVTAQTANDFLKVDNQGLAGGVIAGRNIVNSAEVQLVQVEEIVEFDLVLPNGQAFDSIYFKKGDFTIEFASNIIYPISYQAEVLSLIENNRPIGYSGELDINNGDNYDEALNGVKGLLHLDKSGAITNNKILFKLTYEFEVPVGGDLNASQGVSVDVKIRNAQFSDVFGYLGEKSISVSTPTINFDFFDVFEGGDLEFADPEIEFTIQNSYGFPLGLDYSDVTAVGRDGERVMLSGPITEYLQLVNAPMLGQTGSVETIHMMDGANSNLAEVFSALPNVFSVNVTAKANPENGPDQYNFLNENQQFQGLAIINIPLDMRVSEIIANEQINFNNADNIAQAEQMLLRVVSTNEMPMGGDLELQFIDENGDVYHSLSERPVFSAADLGPDGKTVEGKKLISELLLEDADLRQMEKAEKINVRARLNSTDESANRKVKFFADYTLKLKIAVLAKLKLKTSGI